jgi:hypothetical protein
MLRSLAWSWLAALAFALTAGAQDGPVVVPPQEPAGPAPLESGRLGTLDLLADVDAATSTVVLRSADEVELARIPLGVTVLPSFPPRPFVPIREATELLVSSPDAVDLEAAIFQLRMTGAATDEAHGGAAIGLQRGRHGLYLTVGIPGDALAAALAAGKPPVLLDRAMSGVFADRVHFDVERPPHGIALLPGGSLELDPSSLLTRGARLRGRVAGGSTAGATRVAIRGGGDLLFDSGEVSPGKTAAFDVAVARDQRLRFECDALAAGGAVLEETILVAGDGDQSLHALVVAAGSALELFRGAEGAAIEFPAGTQWLALEDGTPLRGEPAFVLRHERGVVPPLLLAARIGERYLGIGVARLPDSSALGMVDGRLLVHLPTAALAGVPEDSRQESSRGAIVAFAIVAGGSREELLDRYRRLLVDASVAGEIRSTAGATLPPWWREPVLRVAPRPLVPYDAIDASQQVERAVARLRLASWTLLLDGPWLSRPGDLEPSESFTALRAVIARQHVAGARVVLAASAFEAAENSFAERVGAARGGRIDTTNVKAHERYAKEFARRLVAKANDAYGADGIALLGLDRLRDPSLGDLAPANPFSGTGLREMKRHLEVIHATIKTHQEDGLLLAPLAAPQFVEYVDGVLLPPAADRDARGRIETLAAAIPEQPIFHVVSGADDGAYLRDLARAVVLGVPVLDCARLLALDDDSARIAGALASLSRTRPLGVASWQRAANGGGEVVAMGLGGRELARLLDDGRGVVFHPDRERSLVVVLDDQPIALPFAPTRAPDGLRVEFGRDGARLEGAKPGIVYSFER